ncbi:hypothetical protein [Rubinisphaera italica]|uniref:Uncharacterized protein n=1 Tax=Rubinisphaera italica TaxID=2527969 RepID=A0A5C5XI43_9PLAN|nr:hypothetical protein [Rubinisphaera italica]TWT62021.1 hypothetical protein Pan54_27600 [Rubinisphaera italica]
MFLIVKLIVFFGSLCYGMSLSSQQVSSEEFKVSGNSRISSPLANSEIVITTTERLAGAIDSITWNGQEFINSADHGRQLQSATNFDFGSPMIPETFNPTEAGSVADSAGPTSSSRLLHLIADKNLLQTTTQMAFWLPPNGKSFGNPAKNQTILSNHTLTKRVQIGIKDLPQVIEYETTFGLPIDERHNFAQFEVLTGYMPPEFDQFFTYNLSSGEVLPISVGPGEQKHPLIFTTTDKKHAMACVMPPVNFPDGWQGPGYGRFDFPAHRVVKWNCVCRYRNTSGVPATDYQFRTYVLIGDWDLVVNGLTELNKRFQ